MGAFKIVACILNVTAKLSLGEPPFGGDPPSDNFKCTQNDIASKFYFKQVRIVTLSGDI
jgi:hypothetical protein